MQWHKIGVVGLAVLMGAALLLVGHAIPVQAERAQEVTISVTRDPETLDPAHLSWTAAFAVSNNIYGGLVKWETGTFDVVPDLAHSWDVSDDGLTWTFHLREGVQWHRGYGEFTAHDVKYSFTRIADPDTGSRWTSMMALIEGFDAFQDGDADELAGVQVIDDHTVQITLGQPSAVFLNDIARYRAGILVNQQAVEDFGADYEFNPIGTGPFQFVSWIPNDEVVIERNPDYWEGAPTLERVIFKVIPEETVASIAFDAGEIDIMYIDLPENYDRYRADPNVTVHELPSTAVRYANLKTVDDILGDVRVRQAIAHAIDKEAIADFVYGPLAVPLNSVVPAGMIGHTEDITQYPYDPDRARELLREAGYPNGFRTEIYNRDTEEFIDTFTVVQAQLAEVGIEAEMRIMDSTEWIRATTAGESPISPLSLSARPDPDMILSNFFHGRVSSPHGRNFTWFGGADEQIDKARVTVDPDERAAVYREVQEIFAAEVPTIPLVQPLTVSVTQPWVQGFVQGQIEDRYMLHVSVSD